ncbi:hypothetical protein BKA64DRAFT_727754 [Cadophora sp. MPI-SDFR-AT-0126]|nr:hypothetical protein BKA64DRAFT_727754 [Leotiomycetes sp. MPI-SDFR-AT-0126]
MMLFRSVLLLWVFHGWRGDALPVNHTNDQVNAPMQSGTFEHPSVNVRPRFRYWVPDASINTIFFADDIAQLAAKGAGGIEFLNYFDYGGIVGRGPSTDWNIYGYGTPAYREVLKAALQAHEDHGLIMDFSMGPQSGQGVPAEPDEPGLEYNLNYYNVSLCAGETFTGTLPGWGSGELVSAVTFAITKIENVTTVISETAPIGIVAGSVNSTRYTIASSSLLDVSDQVQADGSITVTAPTVNEASTSLLLASYYSRSYTRACIASDAHPQNILQNGSFAVDHFSPVGAQLTTSFLEQYILIDGIDELMRKVGNYIWEDSVEIPGQVYWTPNLTNAFRDQNGYSIEKYVPLLAGKNGQLPQISGVGPVFFVLDAEDEGSGIVGDWRQTMTHLLGTYYDWLTTWTNTYLNLQFSGQIGYNLPVDMLADIPRVNAPETETLSFSDNLDAFRQYCGPADLAGKRVISVELGSTYLETFTQTWTDLLRAGKRGFAAGVNQIIFHGALYSHTYPNTTWPGFTSFSYSFGAHHSRHQPGWNVGYAEAVEYTARTQFILQAGTPKVDLVFWDKRTAELPYPDTLYYPQDLSIAGYTFSYLSPDNFALDVARVSNGTLAGQAFRALIVRANDTMTIDGVQALADFAHAGLPIVISGGKPGSVTLHNTAGVEISGEIPASWNTNNVTGIEQAQRTLTSILSLPNVHQAPYESLASAVAAIGVLPRTKVCSNGTWFTRWREDLNGDVYVFVYNDGNASAGYISFETTHRPIFLNAWTGEECPVVQYTVDGNYVTIPFSLGFTESAIIKFSNASAATHEHIVSAPAFALASPYSPSGPQTLARLIATADTSKPLVLSNGSQIAIPSSIPEAISLTDWTLILEQWLPPTDFFDVESDAYKTNVTLTLPGPYLQPWSSISSSLTNISGIGFYHSTFHWPPSAAASDGLGAMLSLPPIPQGVTASLNGRGLPPLDITNPVLDISSYVVPGENVLNVNVASTLWNVLRPIWGQLRTGTSIPDPPTPEGFERLGHGFLQEYGIIGEVRIVPYMALVL